jgi:hypothetical protein
VTIEKLVGMLLEDVAAAVKDNTTQQGGHMALVLSEQLMGIVCNAYAGRRMAPWCQATHPY